MVPLGLMALLAAAGCATDGDESIATPQPSPARTSAPPASAPASPEPTPTDTPTPSDPPTAPRTDPPTAPTTDPPTGDHAGEPPETSLTIVVNTGTAEGSLEWTLSCDPPDRSHPEPEAACATLADVDPEVFEPVPSDQRCTQVYGGPETATVTGELRGERLRAEFARNNGCEINRWDTLADVLQVEGDGRGGVAGGG